MILASLSYFMELKKTDKASNIRSTMAKIQSSIHQYTDATFLGGQIMMQPGQQTN